MSRISNLSYRTLVYIGLGLYTLAAVFSEGYYHPDEHFQILEFADYKLGITPAADLPWEFHQQIRPALQPVLALGVIKAARALGSPNPFTHALLLRLISGWLALLVFARLSRLLARDFAAESSGKLLLASAVFIWFMPYLAVRFSSENWSGLMFLAGLCFLPLSGAELARRSTGYFAAAGVLLGIAFVFRVHLGFAIAGVAAWLIFQRRIRLGDAGALAAGGLCAVALGAVIDFWFYGNWVFTPWRYFESNILQAKAAGFGVSPWWFYSPDFIMRAVPPLSLALLGLAVVGMYLNRRHVLTWALVPFILGHVVVGHKELRFLFPMAFPFIFFAVAGWEQWKARVGSGKLTTAMLRGLVAINGLALIFVSTRAASAVVSIGHFLYDYSHDRPTTLFAEAESPFALGALRPHFYAAPSLTVTVVPHLADLDDHTRFHPRGGDLLLLRRGTMAPVLPSYQVERIYAQFPDWMLRYDITHWQERSYIWRVYRFTQQR